MGWRLFFGIHLAKSTVDCDDGFELSFESGDALLAFGKNWSDSG